MRIKQILLSTLLVATVLFGCKKTEDYKAIPYACECGNVRWAGVTYDLLAANYIRSDEDVSFSRRYYINAKVKLESETQPHGLGLWIEIPDVSPGGFFNINQQNNLNQFSCRAYEYNLNDPTDTLRVFAPVEGVVRVNPAPAAGGQEGVSFQMILKEEINNLLVGFPLEFSGAFSVRVTN